jgi:hypothetical protein
MVSIFFVSGCGGATSWIHWFLAYSSIERPDQDQEKILEKEQDQLEAPSATAGQDNDDEDSNAKAEELIKDWEKPDFAIFYSGNQKGYIEPCGCTGLDNQDGGLLRRHTALNVLQARGWDLIKIDSGDQVNRPGKQSLIKFERTLEAMSRLMKYDVIGLGLGDFKVSAIDLAQAMINANQGATHFVCANVEVVDPELCQTHRIVERNGKRVGITMVLGDEYLDSLRGIDGVASQPVKSALARAIAKLNEGNCQAKVLIAATSTDNCRKMADQLADFDLVITTDCGGEPTLNPEELDTPRGKVPMVQVGAKSMYVGIVAFYFKAGQPRATLRYKRVPLDSRFKDSEDVKKIFVNYQNELKRLWLAGRFDDIRPQPHASGHKFVGSEACADCHGEEYEVWEDGIDGEGGPHRHATASLTEPNERSWVQRNFDPECVSCHMTGWNPQNFFPYESGFLDIEKDKLLYDNGCENCHGPGSAHVDAERNKKNDTALLEKLRLQVRVTLEQAQKNTCAQCHDLDNSPDFQKEGAFDEYWEQVEH